MELANAILWCISLIIPLLLFMYCVMFIVISNIKRCVKYSDIKEDKPTEIKSKSELDILREEVKRTGRISPEQSKRFIALTKSPYVTDWGLE